MASKMLLVDGNSLMHRAFHALPLMTSESGEYTNALHGFLMMLLHILADEQPDLCAVAFDMHTPTFRHLKYDAYKAGRAPTPDELRAQFRTIHDILNEMHIRVVELEGYEADDLLGTLSLKCEEKGIECLIVTGDRDAFQLAGRKTTVLYTKQGIKDVLRITPTFIAGQWHLCPSQLIDMKGLMGDQSDNIPGIAGIGEKTAQRLLEKYGSLESVLDSAAEQKGKLRERLTNGRDAALFSKWLATINRTAPLGVEPEDCPVRALHDAAPLLKKLSLMKAAARIETLDGMTGTTSAHREIAPECEVLPWEEFAARLPKLNHAVAAVAVGTHLCVAADTGLNIAVRLGGDLLDPGLSEEEAFARLAPALKGAQLVVVHDLKRMLSLGFECEAPVFDVMLAAYVLGSQKRSYSLIALCSDMQIPLNEDFSAAALLRLHDRLREELGGSEHLSRLLSDIEQPLSGVLCRMEHAGVLTDREALNALSDQFTRQIDTLLAGIHEEAGEDINVNSPRQLGVLLFDKMKLPGGKKTKTGWSTSADILEALQDDCPLVARILEYRKYAKLKSTYVDALLRLRGTDGRIRTSFDQTATVTGRISSLEPNLQNIPVRTPLGREIRRAFIAAPEHVLVDADYSQIELRVLAHMSGDERLIDAFIKGEDIHARTAAEVYGVALEDVTSEMRSSAKAVNFGIVYGISDFGLARNIGVTRAEAAAFIARYFERYPQVKAYMDACVALGHTQGYVETLLGRRRYLPELNDKNYAMRQFGERAAMNSPIQGTAADIIKLAMIKTDEALHSAGLQSRLILQVHDELIVEAPQTEAEQAASLLKSCMENIIALKVPLLCEVNTARSWYDCK